MENFPVRCRIPDLEEERNLEPYQVYESLNIPKQQYSSYRNNRHLPNLVNAKIIANFFGVPIDDLHEWPEIVTPRIKRGRRKSE